MKDIVAGRFDADPRGRRLEKDMIAVRLTDKDGRGSVS
jgi:hypothetical protein